MSNYRKPAPISSGEDCSGDRRTIHIPPAMTPATSDAGRVVLTYKAYVVKHRNGDSVGFGADPSGMWVNRADHAATLSALQRKLEDAMALCDQIDQSIEDWQDDMASRAARDLYELTGRMRALLGGDGEGGT